MALQLLMSKYAVFSDLPVNREMRAIVCHGTQKKQFGKGNAERVQNKNCGSLRTWKSILVQKYPFNCCGNQKKEKQNFFSFDVSL